MPVTILNTGTFNQPPAGDPIAARPNDGSGLWADYSNTGYLHFTGSAANPSGSGLTIPCSHGYSGLFDYTSGMSATAPVFVDSPGPLSAAFSKVHFMGKVIIGNLVRCDTMIFNGCVFDGTQPNDNLAQIYLPVLFKLSYCTLKPATLSAPPGNPGTFATSHTYPGTPYLNSWQLIAAFQNSSTAGQTGLFRTEMDHCDVWGNAGMEVTGGGSAATPTFFDHCYIHDQSDTDWETGLFQGLAVDTGTYHQDGIGPDSTGPETWINVTNCTIASMGTTNAIAFQGSAGCNNCVITGNYFSGWELGISLSTAGPTTAHNVTFTDNVWSAEVPYVFGPMYQNWSWNSGGTPPAANTAMLWRRNRWQYFAGDPALTGFWYVCPGGASTCPNVPPSGLVQAPGAPVSIGWGPSWQNTYWWPSDNTTHVTDYTG